MRKTLTISLVLLTTSITLQAQFSCDMPEDSQVRLKSGASGCDLISNYTLSISPSYTPIKTLRIAIDIIQKSDGTGNFIDEPSIIVNKLNKLIESANSRLGNIKIHNPLSSGPYIPDSKIRIQLNGVYFFQDDGLYNYGLQRNRDRTIADSIYEHVIQKRNNLTTICKEHTLHVIMLPGGTACCGGQASWFGDKKWIVMRGYDYAFNWGVDPVEEVVGHLIHEVGHSLGLYHNFQGGPNGNQCDDCDDNSCPIEGTSNNYMDYTKPHSNRTSFSDCQISKIHYCLMGNLGNISDDYVQDYCIFDNTQTISINSGQNIIWNNSKNLLGNIEIKNSGVLTIKCNISIPKGGKVTVNNGGKLILQGDFKNSCEDIWTGIEVLNGGYLEINSSTISDYKIIIKNGGSLKILGSLNIVGANGIDIKNGAYICIESGANITLQNYLSVINLHTGYLSGLNPSLNLPTTNCSANPANIALTTNSKGKINTFTQDLYIQNQTISSNKYYVGKNIYVGRNVTTSQNPGDVIINNNSVIIFDAEQEVILDKGFEVIKGSSFEIIK